jgi:hypothetical protein
MKNFTAMLVLFLLVAALSSAQEKGTVTVKDGVSSNGAVSLEAVLSGKKVELQCNLGNSECKLLKPGEYVVVVLPPNRGMYDCKNLDLYPNGAEPAADNKLGEYCLSEK